jgi:hypothetical protein
MLAIKIHGFTDLHILVSMEGKVRPFHSQLFLWQRQINPDINFK